MKELTYGAIDDAIEKFKREYEFDRVRFTPTFSEERYGYRGSVQVKYKNSENNLVVVAILPEHGTGVLPEGSQAKAGHKVLRPHDENTHEWIFNISETPRIERYSSQFDFGTQGQLIRESLFPSHRTLYELEEELHLNPPSPKGVTFRMHDWHALFNSGTDPQILLVHPVKRGAPLNTFQEMLLEKTGTEKYLLGVDPKTGRMHRF